MYHSVWGGEGKGGQVTWYSGETSGETKRVKKGREEKKKRGRGRERGKEER